ncbi:hypothetical protein LP419_30630 [Massilia sp. H-1]|nr:hypothetical protein LP419_30630 [Massilia sp. H-1]
MEMPTPSQVQVRHFRRHPQIDAAALEHGRGEAHGDAEFFSSSRISGLPPLLLLTLTGMKILPCLPGNWLPGR